MHVVRPQTKNSKRISYLSSLSLFPVSFSIFALFLLPSSDQRKESTDALSRVRRTVRRTWGAIHQCLRMFLNLDS
jgi:uncharacterized BrkB/YihY/UPF0761 family membrane protein